MTIRPSRLIATALLLTIALLPAGDATAAKKKRRRKSSAKAAPVKVESATGNTLQERLDSLINGKVAKSSEVSIQIVEVESGAVVAERNAHTPLAPASNMKLFTTGAALDLLHPDFEVKTTVYARGATDPTGTLEGDVKIVGHGDPTIGGRFHDNHATAVIDEWATDLKRSGIKTIHGNLIF